MHASVEQTDLTTLSNFTVPANTTIALMLYTSSNFCATGNQYSTINNYYVQFLEWYVHSFRSKSLVKGLEIDVDKTLKAWQSPGLTATCEIWK